MKSASIYTLIGATLVSGIVGSFAAQIGSNMFNNSANASSPFSMIDSRVTSIETREAIKDKNDLNRDNKVDYLVGAVYKISNKLNVEVGTPPVNQ